MAAARAASSALSSGVPLVPSSQRVRSTTPVFFPCNFSISKVPEHPSSTSSGCTAIANISSLMALTLSMGANLNFLPHPSTKSSARYRERPHPLRQPPHQLPQPPPPPGASTTTIGAHPPIWRYALCEVPSPVAFL